MEGCLLGLSFLGYRVILYSVGILYDYIVAPQITRMILNISFSLVCDFVCSYSFIYFSINHIGVTILMQKTQLTYGIKKIRDIQQVMEIL